MRCPNLNTTTTRYTQHAADGVDNTQGSDAGSSSQRGGRGRGRGDNTTIDTVVEGMPIE